RSYRIRRCALEGAARLCDASARAHAASGEGAWPHLRRADDRSGQRSFPARNPRERRYLSGTFPKDGTLRKQRRASVPSLLVVLYQRRSLDAASTVTSTHYERVELVAVRIAKIG